MITEEDVFTQGLWDGGKGVDTDEAASIETEEEVWDWLGTRGSLGGSRGGGGGGKA